MLNGNTRRGRHEMRGSQKGYGLWRGIVLRWRAWMEAPKHVPALRQRKAREEPRAGLLKMVRAHVPPQGRTCPMKEGYR